MGAEVSAVQQLTREQTHSHSSSQDTEGDTQVMAVSAGSVANNRDHQQTQEQTHRPSSSQDTVAVLVMAVLAVSSSQCMEEVLEGDTQVKNSFQVCRKI